MEIKSLKVIGDKAYFRFVCESCKKEVDGSDKFCRNCGSELEPMVRVEKLADVASILTAVFKGKPLPPKKIESDVSVSVSPDNDDVGRIEDNNKPSSEFNALKQSCPRCKSQREGCEFLQSDGECRGIVYPTYPPQYPKCVYDKKREELS